MNSPLLHWFVVVMGLAFIVTTILGLAMALRFGRSRRGAMLCLAGGFLFPLSLAALKLLSQLRAGIR